MTCSPFPLNVGSTTLTRGDTWSQEFWFENPDATRINLDAEGWANWRSWRAGTPGPPGENGRDGVDGAPGRDGTTAVPIVINPNGSLMAVASLAAGTNITVGSSYRID